MLIVVANVFLKEGKASEFIEASKHCISETRKEEGNISYILLQGTENDSNFTFLEEWESKDHLDEHMKTEHFISLVGSMKDLLREPLEVNIYDAKKHEE